MVAIPQAGVEFCQGQRMKKWLPSLFALCLAGVASAGIADRDNPSGASSRQALLIANADYVDNEVALRHPITDARALADELRRAGFDVVVGTNLGKQAMQTAIADFTSRIKPGSAALIFFGGHGIQLAQQNYLLPVNAQIWSEADVRRDGIPLDSVLADMDRGGARVKLVVVDASRENPFERRFRGQGAGLVSLTAPEGTLIAYSAAPDTVASDGQGENSPFIAEFVRQVRSTGSTAEQVFMAAARGVSRSSDSKRVPWISSALGEGFSFTELPPKDTSLVQGREATPTSPPEPESAVKPSANKLINERAIAELSASDRTGARVSSRQPAESASGPQSEPKIPRLIFQASRATKGQPVPLGVALGGPADDAVVTVAGLAPGMTLSTGYPLGADSWQVPAADLARTWIGPPTDFVGIVDLVAEVHVGETIVHRGPIQFEWAAASAALAAALPAIEPQPPGRPAPPAVVPPRLPVPEARQLDREEIALLLKRGRDLMASGDLSAARLVLQRAAEARDAEAAMALAATYD
ncbi:MAG: caspase domain-containing protein, partial [Xanthobacteraceae bacterium]